MELTYADVAVVVGAIAGVAALPIAALPAIDAANNLFGRKRQLKAEILDQLRRVAEAQALQSANHSRHPIELLREKSRDIPYIRDRFPDNDTVVFAAIKDLIDAKRITLWLDGNDPVPLDAVLESSDGGSSAARIVRPRLFLGQVPDGIVPTVNGERIAAIFESARVQTRKARRLAKASVASSFGAVAAAAILFTILVNRAQEAHVSDKAAQPSSPDRCPGQFFSGTEALGTLPLQWDFDSNRQVGARIGTIRSFCNSTALFVVQTAINDDNPCTFWAGIDGKSVSGNYICPKKYGAKQFGFSGVIQDSRP